MSDRCTHEAAPSMTPDDLTSFDEVVSHYAAPLTRFFRRRMSDVQSVENLIQETFLRVFRYARSYRAGGRLSSWIFAIAANLHRDFVRGESRGVVTVAADPEAGALGSRTVGDPESTVLDREFDRTLLGVLESMPSHHRDVFILKHHYALSYAEVGTVLGISEGTVKSRMHKATRVVAEKLARRGFLRFEGGDRS